MKTCNFPGCTRLPHDSTVLHAAWSGDLLGWVPLTEQRTRAQIARDNTAAARQAKAEQIADRLIDDYANATDHPDDLQIVRGLLADAALAALNERD